MRGIHRKERENRKNKQKSKQKKRKTHLTHTGLLMEGPSHKIDRFDRPHLDALSILPTVIVEPGLLLR
jgi:hypothetical protein